MNIIWAVVWAARWSPTDTNALKATTEAVTGFAERMHTEILQ
jgi:hypothetical protein